MWIIDILPVQVPAKGEGQYFAVAEYFRQEPQYTEIRRKMLDLLLKLNCYYRISLFFPEEEIQEDDPKPERLAGLMKDECMILIGDSLITAGREDLYMTCYSEDQKLLQMIGTLAEREGLYLRRAGA